MQEEWAFYITIAILFTLIRHVPTDTNETITHTNSTVVLDGIILDTLHEETTNANSENMWATFLKRFFSGKSFRHPIRKEERRTFHKGFRNLRRRYR